MLKVKSFNRVYAGSEKVLKVDEQFIKKMKTINKY